MKASHRALSGLILSSILFTACAKEESSGGALPEAPDAAIEAVAQRLSEGDAGVLWQAMPESYRGDLTEIAHQAGTVVDAEIYDRSFGLVGRIADVAEKQKSFILNSSFAANWDTEAANANWQPVVDFFRLVANSEIATASGLQSLDLKAFFEGTGSKFLAYIEEIAALSGEATPLAQLAALKATVVDANENEAALRIEMPGEAAETQSFTKVEGKWVPTEMAAGWSTQMVDARAKLAAAAEATASQNQAQVAGILTMFEGVLTQLEAAESQAQFNQALQGAMMPMMGLLMLGNSLGGAEAAPAAPAVPVPVPPAN